jgi:hypothetical protein
MNQLRSVPETISNKTLAEFGSERLAALCTGAGASSSVAEIVRLFDEMVRPWGNRVIGPWPRYPSTVADDAAPFEFSAAFSDGPPEIQFYVEALGDPPSLYANMQAGRSLLDRLARKLGGSLERLALVEDLFFPPEPRGPFTIWVGASCKADRKPRLKVYLNPQVSGAADSRRLVGEAMARLGVGSAWPALNEQLATSAARYDEIAIVSLDLSGDTQDRIKLYIRHHGATVQDVQAFVGSDPDSARDAELFFSVLAGNQGPFSHKPPITEAVFVSGDCQAPSSFTLEFPIGKYVATDEIAAQRIEACLSAFGLPGDGYRSAAEAFATRPLAVGGGLHAHVTLRRQGNRPRVGVYFASEAYPTSTESD